MKKIVIPTLILLLILLAVGCEPEAVHEAVPLTAAGMLGVVNIGNMTYIPLNLDGSLESNIETVFAALSQWEKEHTDREVVDIDYIHKQLAHGSAAYTYGVVVYSKAIN